MSDNLRIHFVVASRDHLSSIVSLLADDRLGSTREIAGDELDARYIAAFDEIQADQNNELIIAEHDGSVVGTLQINYAASLTHKLQCERRSKVFASTRPYDPRVLVRRCSTGQSIDAGLLGANLSN